MMAAALGAALIALLRRAACADPARVEALRLRRARAQARDH
jgi:hypothetical protein